MLTLSKRANQRFALDRFQPDFPLSGESGIVLPNSAVISSIVAPGNNKRFRGERPNSFRTFQCGNSWGYLDGPNVNAGPPCR
jgi:hypothetical protein